ncbi:hypothetical protein BJY52DRAFT_1193975 [Lactarius psammicola]|nr:hypothetical protein BJY52DRAFT_1193975 [Lactarius psammicola]
MDAGFDPNTQPAPEIMHQTQYGVRDDHTWLLSSSPLLPAGSAELQGTAPSRHHALPPIVTLAPLPAASFDSLQSSVQYTQASVQEITVAEPQTRAGLSEVTKRYIKKAAANLRAIRATKILNCLPIETRRIIREAVEQQVFQPAPCASPEVIFVRSSTADPCDVVVPPSRPVSVASAWSHVMRETNDTGYTLRFRTEFPELRVRDFIESIDQALRAPVLNEVPSRVEDPSWIDEDGTVERIKNELMMELGRDVSESQTSYANFYLAAPLQLHKDNDYPCSNEGFNLSATLVINALDSGVEDSRGDLEQAGLIPSSWFRLATAVLGAILHGALRSGGRKIQGHVKIDDTDGDIWTLADGLTPPVTQGGRIATQAQQLTNFFMHYAGADEPPLADFYESVLRVGQAHIEKVVRLKAAATYQISTNDAKGLVDMVYDDMVCQTYDHMVKDDVTRHNANQKSLDRLFVEAQEQLGPFIGEWKMLYRHHLVEALKEDEEARTEDPTVTDPLLEENAGYIKLFAYNRVKELRESIARTVMDPVLDGDEITRARERIRLDHAEEIEAARRETRAQISLEKKAWAVAYRDSVKLDWLTKVAEELGFVLISKDDAEERKGWSAKCHAGPVVISGISVPAEATDISVFVAPAQDVSLPDPTPPSRVLTPDSMRGVASSMHNPENAMANDLPPAKAPEAVVVPPALPSLQPIPLLPGLAEMLNTLQANLMTSFTTQINTLSSRIDAQDEIIRIRSLPKKSGKDKAVTPGPSAPIPAANAAPILSRAPSQPPPVQTTPPEVLPVPDPLPVPAPSSPSHDNPPTPILQAKARAGANANIIGQNTEITIARGAAARSAMERMSAQAPPVLYGRWSINANSHNFVYVFAGVVPFSTILQYTKALVEPLGVGNPLPNKGWTFAQLRGVPTSDGAGVIHSTDTLLQEIRQVPFFNDAIFVSKPHWQLPVTSLAHATRGVVQLAFIDEEISLSSHSAGGATKVGHATNAPACKLGPNSVKCHICGGSHRGQDHGFHCKVTTHVVAVRGGFKPSPLAEPSSHTSQSWAPTQTANAQTTTDTEGFTTVGKGGKDAPPQSAATRTGKRTRKRKSKTAGIAGGDNGLPTAGPSNPNTNGTAQGSSVMNVLFPEDVATITETVDAFHKLAYAVCDGSKEDLQRAMVELEGGWGSPTEHLDHLFSLLARYAVKHNLPLTIPQVEDTIARGEGGFEKAAERVHAFRAAWGSAQPIHYVYHLLPGSTRFATDDEVDAHRTRQAKTSDRMRQFNDAVEFTINLSRFLFENNVTSRPLASLEAEVVVTTNSLEQLFSLDNPGPIGDRVAEEIKKHIQQDAARLFSLASIMSYA